MRLTKLPSVSLLSFLVLLLADTSDAGIASRITSVAKVLVKRAIGRRTQILIFDGVQLPPDITIRERLKGFLQLNPRTNIDVGSYLLGENFNETILGIHFGPFGPSGMLCSIIVLTTLLCLLL